MKPSGTAPTSSPGSAPAPGSTPFMLDAQTRLYLWLTGVFVTSLVLANVIGVKLFRFELTLTADWTVPISHTAGMLPFPITFLLTDLLNEYYGKKAARRVTWIAFAMAAFAFVLIWAARALPTLEGIPGTADAGSFETVFGSSSVMYIASILAFLVGSMLDIGIFGVFKRLTGQKLVWLRTTGSTVISQVFDSFVVTWLFFQGLPLLLGQQTAGFDFVLKTAAT
ncbi:MAG: queuosine precursor transporter, partial [Planctomycetes bacterium]|nr:queuosine precursor transporter [Planctomycetota bacterium]